MPRFAWIAVACLAGFSLLGCVIDSPRVGGATDPGGATTRPGAGEVMAYVNGSAIPMSRLIDRVLEGPGMSYVRQLVGQELVRQEMEKKKITVSDAEVQAESDRMLRTMAPQAKTDQEREQVLNRLLAQRQLSRRQWLQSLRQLAELRKLAGPNVEVTDTMLREGFARRYGRQVTVRHIEVKSFEKARDILEEANAGANFGDLAMTHSIGRTSQTGGMLPPIGPKTEGVWPAVRQAALSLNRAGQISPVIATGDTFHIVKAEGFIEPKDVKFEEVKDALADEIREGLIFSRQRQILQDLHRSATVRYVHPAVKRLAAEKKQAEGKQP